MASVNKVSASDDKSALAAKLYMEEKKSIPDIAQILEWPRSRVRQKLLGMAVVLRSRSEGVRAASSKLGKHLAGKKIVFTPQWRANISEARRAYAETNASGISKKTNGYVEYTRGENKGRSVHVVTMEKRLGRPLLTDEVVHHIDGNKHNNDINNLALMTRSAHARLHRREEQITRKENGLS